MQNYNRTDRKNAKHEILTLWYIGNTSGFVRESFAFPSARVFWHYDTFVFTSLWHNVTFYGNLLSSRLLPIVIVYRGRFFCTRRKKFLYAYKIFFLRDADNSASYIRFVIMLLANEHPLSFCHLRYQKKITKSWLILNTECTLKPNNLITFHEFLCVLCVLCVLIFFKPNCLE